MTVRRLVLVVAAATGLAFILATALGQGAQAGSGITFGHAVVVDHQRVTGEPSLSISPTLNTAGKHDIYVSSPWGFSTTTSYLWKSEDGGQTFHLAGDEAPPEGKPAMTCAGGGDSSIVNDNNGNLYFGDLQGLTDISASVSVDGGNTFVTTCNAASETAVDRPWLAVNGDPLSNGREYMTVDDTEQCDPDRCGLGQVGSNLLQISQASGANALTQTFLPSPGQQIEPDGIVGGAVVNQANGDLYIVHTAYTDANGNILGGGDANANDNAVVVDRFPGGYSQTTPTPIPPGDISLCKPYNAAGPCRSEDVVHAPLDSSSNSTINAGQDFATMAIDSSGNLYVVWAQSPVDSSGNADGPTSIYMATSSNQGATWTKPINVSSHVPGLQTNVFPWLAAGSSGRVDLVWLGTPTLGGCPGSPCGAGFITGSWNVYMAQTVNAVTSSGAANPNPSFTTTKVSEYPIHTGQICEFGIACTTGGDRGLADFIQVQADPSGAADIVYADGANSDFNGGETTALTTFVQQTGGPGLYGGTITGTARSGSAPGSPAAYYAAGGSETPAAPGSNMRIVNSSVTRSGSNFIVTMKVGSLASLQPDPSLGGTDAIWLTRWELPNPHPTIASQGHVFYAAMESDAGGTPTFYDAETACVVPPTNPAEHCKVMGYAPAHTIKGSYTPSGTITLTVPMADVGGSGSLYSVTGLTATQTAPASTGGAIFSVIASTPPYNVK